MRLRSLLCSLVVLSALVGDVVLSDNKVAHAQFIGDRPFSGGRRMIELNFHGNAYYGFDWYNGGATPYYNSYAFGPGFQMLFPVVQNGFIKTLNNAFYVGFFTDLNFHSAYNYNYNYNNNYSSFISLAIGPFVQWRFYLFPILSVYANLGFGIWPWFFGNDYYGHSGVDVHFFPMFELGANLHFTRRIGMNFEFGYPAAKIGINIGF